jgi:MFS family permease
VSVSVFLEQTVSKRQSVRVAKREIVKVDRATPRAATMSRGALVAACGIGLATGWNNTNTGAVASLLSRQYGISLAGVGLLTTALFLVHLTMQIPGGKTSERFGARRAALAGLAVIAAANALALLAPAPALAYLARGLMGVGTGIAFVSGSAYVRESGGSPLAQGLYGGLGLGGGGLALVVVPQAVTWFGWRAPFATALFVLAITWLALLASPADRPVPRRPRPEAGAGGLFRDRRLHRLGAVYAASLGLSIVTGNWVVTLLERAGNAPAGVAGAVGSLTQMAPVITRPLGGWLLRNHPSRIRLAVGLSLAGGAVGALAIAVARPLPLVACGAVLIGIAAGIPFAPAFTGAARIRPDTPVAAVGLVNSGASAVIVAGTPLLGLTFSLPGSGRLGFLIVALLFVLPLLVLPSGRELGGSDADRSLLPGGR